MMSFHTSFIEKPQNEQENILKNRILLHDMFENYVTIVNLNFDVYCLKRIHVNLFC